MRNKICNTLMILTLIIFSFSTWAYCLKQREQVIYKEAKASFLRLYADVEEGTPAEDITYVDINNARKKLSLIADKYNDEKEDMYLKMNSLNDYLALNEEIDYYFEDGILKSDINENQIYGIEIKFNEIEDVYKKELEEKVTSMINQYELMLKLNKAVDNLFSDSSRKNVAKNISYNDYNEAYNLVHTIKQKEIVEKEKEYLSKVKKELDRKEEEKQKRILNAWTKLKVPYVSQNYAKVYNGCEVASLLMALKYKGYLKNTTLNDYAKKVPKSTDPYVGFVNSIYDAEPRDVVHWIAPKALAKFGRDSSNNSNVIDMTGSSLSQLNKEIENGNPVIIYLTSYLTKPMAKKNGVTGNLHVLLLTGYNSITGEEIITDPWTRSNGTKTWQISKKELEKIYNEVGKMAVVVR